MAALKQLQASREGAVYIGDSDVDIMTAKIAKCLASAFSGDSAITIFW